MKFLKFLETLWISEWIALSDFGYPVMLAFHSIGLAAVVGITTMMALRLLGVARRLPLSGFARLTPFAVAGFVLNAVSGVLLFMSDGSRLISNWPFLLKMAAVILGAVLFRLMSKAINLDWYRALPNAAVIGPEPEITRSTQLIAVALLMTWFVAIVAGRLIAHVLDAAALG